MWQLKGHRKALHFFKNVIEKGKVSHAYLLSGKPHTGKMTLAIDLGKALNCKEKDSPCGNCQSCLRIQSLNHADVRVVNLKTDDDIKPFPRTMISKEQIKRIRHEVSLPPYEGKTRVVIIDGAENMSLGAANAFLKTLEEPSDKVLFLLLAVDESRLPETVTSRCQRVELLPVATKEIEKELESRSVSQEKAELLSRLSNGKIGWAITASKNDDIIENRSQHIEEAISLINGDYEERFGYVTKLARQFGKERGVVWDTMELWLDLWRDLMFIKMELDEDITNTDIKEKLVMLSEGFKVGEIRKAMEDIIKTEEKLKINVNPQLALEVLMLSIPSRKGVVV